uniref:Putative secreted protein n=1 Tax=Ixodes ricinus TaxID=34613 RepID=A0A147BML7_IXORI
MAYQITIQSKGLWTQLALVWLFRCAYMIEVNQIAIPSKGMRIQVALKKPITCVLSVTMHIGPGVKGNGRMLAVEFFITMGNQVAHDCMPISSDIGAETASKPDVLSGFQGTARLSQQCCSITMNRGRHQLHINCCLQSGS